MGIVEMMLMFFRKVEERLFAVITGTLSMILLVLLLFGAMPDISLHIFAASFLLVAASSLYTAKSTEEAYSRMWPISNAINRNGIAARNVLADAIPIIEKATREEVERELRRALGRGRP